MLERGPQTTISHNEKRHDSLISSGSAQTSAAPAGSYKHKAYTAKNWSHQKRLLKPSARTARDTHSRFSAQGHSHHEQLYEVKPHLTSFRPARSHAHSSSDPDHSMSLHKFSMLRRVHYFLGITLTVFELPKPVQHTLGQKIIVSDSVRTNRKPVLRS